MGFIITTLQKLLTSSKYAFLKSLEKRLEQIKRFKSLTINLEQLKEEDPEYFELEFEEENIESDVFDILNGIKTNKKEKFSLDLINQEKLLTDFHKKLSLLPYDTKSNKLIELLIQIYEKNPIEKVLIFTQFVDTLKHLREIIKSQISSSEVEVFFGGMDKDEKDKAVERFRASKKFSVLISTEIGGEGRNFQFCRVLINYDLPWNPMKLEQRIGRLDRIGQESKEIYIYNFFLEGTIETDILFALNKRINLFEESIGVLEPIIGKIEKGIKEIIFVESEGRKRKKLNDFYRNLDEQFQRAKEIEMQFEDLLIDKKSFRMDDLITSCEDVKLTHNELYLLMKYFFELRNHAYGYLESFKDTLIKVKLKDILLTDPNFKLSEEYIGTFDLNFAREREDIDFFALGHPLINTILDFCRQNSFKGRFTFLKIKRAYLHDDFPSNFYNDKALFLLIFNVKFQGYIIEHQYVAIIVDETGKEVENMAEIVLKIENFPKIFEFDKFPDELANLNQNLTEKILQNAKALVKRKSSAWKQEIKALNDKIYNLERNKKEKIYKYKSKILTQKIESLKRKLERKEKQKPTEKQMKNIMNLTDQTKKEERLKRVKQIEEDISFLKRDITATEKKIDDLAFQYDDLKREMIKRNLAKFYTNLSSLALVKIIE